MKLILKEDETLNRGQLLICYHRDDKKITKEIVERFKLCMKRCVLYEREQGRTSYRINYVEIYMIQLVNGEVLAYTNHGRVLAFHKSFHEVKQDVVPYYFLQISKSMLINMVHVAYFDREAHYRLKLTMDNGEEFIVNRSFRKQFLETHENA